MFGEDQRRSHLPRSQNLKIVDAIENAHSANANAAIIIQRLKREQN